MFWDYFQHFYLHQEFGVTYILTNIICAVAISLIFNKTRWQCQSVLHLFIDALITWVLSFLLQSLFYTLGEATGLSDFNIVSRYCVWGVVALLHTIYPHDIEKYWMRFTYAILLASFIFLLISTSGQHRQRLYGGAWLSLEHSQRFDRLFGFVSDHRSRGVVQTA
jgi:hypothetical protein